MRRGRAWPSLRLSLALILLRATLFEVVATDFDFLNCSIDIEVDLMRHLFVLFQSAEID